jgi:hypothetical protein
MRGSKLHLSRNSGVCPNKAMKDGSRLLQGVRAANDKGAGPISLRGAEVSYEGGIDNTGQLCIYDRDDGRNSNWECDRWPNRD